MTLKNMTPEVELLIQKQLPACCGMYLLYVKNGKLHLGKTITVPRERFTICSLTADEMNEGLVPAKWELINYRLMTLQREDLLCPNTQKH